MELIDERVLFSASVVFGECCSRRVLSSASVVLSECCPQRVLSSSSVVVNECCPRRVLSSASGVHMQRVLFSASGSSSSGSSRDGLIGPLPAKCRPEAFDAHSFTTFRERGKTG